MRARTTIALVFGLMMLAGCKKKDVADAGADAAAAAPSAEPSATADDSTADAAPPTAKIDPDWLPASTDEETRSKKEVTKASYKTDLDAIDKEISSEK